MYVYGSTQLPCRHNDKSTALRENESVFNAMETHKCCHGNSCKKVNWNEAKSPCTLHCIIGAWEFLKIDYEKMEPPPPR